MRKVTTKWLLDDCSFICVLPIDLKTQEGMISYFLCFINETTKPYVDSSSDQVQQEHIVFYILIVDTLI